mgnify:FL=1|jgi:isopenicillin-N N-acyltransferase like protein
MGYAHGTIMKEQVKEFMSKTWEYLEEQVESGINGTENWIPRDILDWIARVGLDTALDLTYDATKPFTGAYFYEEMQGLSDASGFDYKTIRRIHMIGELTKGSCSMYGAWGKATSGGKLLQLRALDWDTSGYFQDFPQITVYHPSGNGSNGHAFANVGWTGWIGSITGMSSNQMAISEIGVTFPDATFGKESRFGIPFTFILRDIIQFDQTLDNALSRIAEAHRTCDLILGVGDGKLGEFRGIQYSHEVSNFIDDQNLRPVADWHAPIESVVYFGMDWLCPAYSQALHDQLVKNYGTLTPEATIKDITAIAQTGDLHIAIYDLTANWMFVANARKTTGTGPAFAYDRTFNRLNMTAVFDEKL